MLSIRTTRYSKVVSAFVERYPGAEVRIDKKPPSAPLVSWCTNAVLRQAINFSLRRGQVELLGFHDGPDNMWADTEAAALIEELALQKVLRYESTK